MIGLAHHLEVGGVVGLGLTDVAAPNAVAGEETRIEARGMGCTLDDRRPLPRRRVATSPAAHRYNRSPRARRLWASRARSSAAEAA